MNYLSIFILSTHYFIKFFFKLYLSEIKKITKISFFNHKFIIILTATKLQNIKNSFPHTESY